MPYCRDRQLLVTMQQPKNPDFAPSFIWAWANETKHLIFCVCLWKIIAFLSMLQFVSLHLCIFWLSHNSPFTSTPGHLDPWFYFFVVASGYHESRYPRCGRAIKTSFGQGLRKQPSTDAPTKSSKHSTWGVVHGKNDEPTLPCEEEKSVSNTARSL